MYARFKVISLTVAFNLKTDNFASTDLAVILAYNYNPNSSKNIRTCTKNWYQCMNTFGSIVSEFSFPQDDLSRSHPRRHTGLIAPS